MKISDRKIFVLIQMIIFACAPLLTKLQIHDSDKGLWEAHQTIERVSETTIPNTTMIETNVPIKTVHKTTIPMTAVRETKIAKTAVSEIIVPISILPGKRGPIPRNTEELEEGEEDEEIYDAYLYLSCSYEHMKNIVIETYINRNLSLEEINEEIDRVYNYLNNILGIKNISETKSMCENNSSFGHIKIKNSERYA